MLTDVPLLKDEDIIEARKYYRVPIGVALTIDSRNRVRFITSERETRIIRGYDALAGTV